MTEPGKIFKSGGHCYGPMGYPDCAYWDKDTPTTADGAHYNEPGRCRLFGDVDKDASRALEVCDRVFGKDYEGRA